MVYTKKKNAQLKETLERMMKKKEEKNLYSFVSYDKKSVLQQIGKEEAKKLLRQMLTIRHMEIRAESAYLQGQIGGFFHAYIGQEAIQTACVDVFGQNNWWITSYRCHALAYLTGASVQEIMLELYGRADGNAMGRGGSMHLYSDRMLGGFGIVGGQVPIALGAALSIKYLKKKEETALCFLGDGAVAQGTFHESLNLAVLWDLPCVIVVENNKWGMGTAVKRAVAVEPIAEKFAACYKIEGYTLDGMDLLACYQGFSQIKESSIKNRKPILVEVITERFRGHSISDPAKYRTKEALKEAMEKDSIIKFKEDLKAAQYLTEEEYQEMDKAIREEVIQTLKAAEKSDWPDPIVLEEGVYKEEE